VVSPVRRVVDFTRRDVSVVVREDVAVVVRVSSGSVMLMMWCNAVRVR